MNIEFREPADKQELESLLMFRYKVYSEDSSLNSMIMKSVSNLDVNIYDLKALHYGAFVDNIPIAYIRMTTENVTHFTPWIEQLLSETKIHLVNEKRTYPFQNYYPDEVWSNEFIQKLHGRKVGEVGRLAIDKNYRANGIVLTEFIKSFVQYFSKEHSFKTGFGSCTLALERFYLKFGFSRAEGSKPFVYKDLPEAVIVTFEME